MGGTSRHRSPADKMVEAPAPARPTRAARQARPRRRPPCSNPARSPRASPSECWARKTNKNYNNNSNNSWTHRFRPRCATKEAWCPGRASNYKIKKWLSTIHRGKAWNNYNSWKGAIISSTVMLISSRGPASPTARTRRKSQIIMNSTIRREGQQVEVRSTTSVWTVEGLTKEVASRLLSRSTRCTKLTSSTCSTTGPSGTASTSSWAATTCSSSECAWRRASSSWPSCRAPSTWD